MDALIVIDMQDEMVKGVHNRDRVIGHIQKLIEHFHKKNHAVIFTQEYHTSNDDHDFLKWGKHCFKGTKGVEIIKELKGYKHKLIRKKRYSAFFKTGLEKFLKEKKVKRLFITGIYTEFCVLSTALDAYYRDYDIYIVKDASSSHERKVHRSFVYYIAERTGHEIKTLEVLKTV